MGTKNIYYTNPSGLKNNNIKNYIIEVESKPIKKESIAPKFISNQKRSITTKVECLFLWFDNLIQKEFLDAR